MNSGHRVEELDILRSIGIVCVLLGHLPNYLPPHPWSAWLYYAFTSLGVGLFVCVSGFALTQRYMYREGFRPFRFLKRRLVRVYALYIPALLLFVLEFHFLRVYHEIDLSPLLPNLLVHILAGQALLFPWASQLPTLWFVGMIVFFYVCFGLIALCRSGPEGIAVIALTVAILSIYRLVLGIVDIRVFLYYPVFLSGILLRRLGVLSSNEIGRRLGLSAMVLWLGSYVLFRALGLEPARNWSCNNQLLRCLPSLAMIEAYVLSGTLFLLWLASNGVRRMSEGMKRIALRMSVASYAVYLFHRPVFAVLGWFGENVVGLSLVIRVGLLVLLAVGLFAAGYWIQTNVNQTLRKWGVI